MTSKDKDVPYINASIISDNFTCLHIVFQTYNAGCYFIVAQDPVPTNIDIFWRCVVDNCIACIVTLDEDESCVKYWPENNATVTFENIKVKTTGITQSSYCVKRTLEVSKANLVPRVVKQIELKDWPANGIPPSTNSLLETISAVEKCQTNAQEVKGKKILALVHCRDGSSQAGTFCAISNLVDRLKNENCVDVFRTVKDIRDLRQGAVGNIELYKYCYQAVNEFLESFDLYANFK
ncbi:receptor-type tyrosine-protein phosphatase alpha-like [Clavelina lepadiformis]|uniref:receptor-type tyrosine-protein phosphatase alpha-like n=1 Tax=Clavelina lepadiformis TaxID=159417 RepID=UPI004041AAB5